MGEAIQEGEMIPMENTEIVPIAHLRGALVDVNIPNNLVAIRLDRDQRVLPIL